MEHKRRFYEKKFMAAGVANALTRSQKREFVFVEVDGGFEVIERPAPVVVPVEPAIVTKIKQGRKPIVLDCTPVLVYGYIKSSPAQWDYVTVIGDPNFPKDRVVDFFKPFYTERTLQDGDIVRFSIPKHYYDKRVAAVAKLAAKKAG